MLRSYLIEKMNEIEDIEDVIKTENAINEEWDPKSLEPEYIRIADNESTPTTTEVVIKQEPEDPLGGLIDDGYVKAEEEQITVLKYEKEEPPDEIESVFLNEYTSPVYLYCDTCNQAYEDFCLRCPMLLHILNNKIALGTPDRARKTIPSKFLELREDNRVFTIRKIPVGVTFGPHEGLIGFAARGGCCFEIDKGKLMCVESSERSNWLQFLSYTTHHDRANLIMFQSNGGVYFRIRTELEKGHELLAYWGKPVYQKYFQPVVMENISKPFSCVPCCLGFSLKTHLKTHWSRCPNEETSRYLFKYSTIGADASLIPKLMEIPTLTENASSSTLILKNQPSGQLPLMNQCIESRKTYFKKLVSQKVKDIPTPKRYCCEICDKEFVFLENLQSHALIHKSPQSPSSTQQQTSETIQKSYKCAKCQEIFKTLPELGKHEHAQPPPKKIKITLAWKYKCTSCMKSFESQEDLDKHSHKPPAKPKKKKFKCDKCNRVYLNEVDLVEHSAVHVKPKVKLFKCNYCDHMSVRRCMDFVSHMLHKYDKSKEDETPRSKS